MSHKTTDKTGKISKKSAPYQGVQVAIVTTMLRDVVASNDKGTPITEQEAQAAADELNRLTEKAIEMLRANRDHWLQVLAEKSNVI